MNTLNKALKLRCYGDSLALPRIGVVSLEQTYLFQFTRFLESFYGTPVHLIDRSKASATSIDLLSAQNHDDAYFGNEVDIQIIHCGICDCAPRPLPSRVRGIVSRLPQFVKTRIIAGLHENRGALLRNGFSWRVVDVDTFQKTIYDWIDICSRHAKRVYLINIAPTNDETEAHSPGLRSSINTYNQLLAQVAAKHESLCFLIDLNQMISARLHRIDDLILKDDGHHITPTVHEWITETLIQNEKLNRITL